MPEIIITRSVFELDDVEVREENGKKTISGYAAVFERLSVPIYDFREKIRRGAFTASLKKNNIRALWNHDSGTVLGATKSGTLRLSEDDKGLRFELNPPDTQAGRDAVELIKRGDVEGMSFGFRVIKQEWDESDKKNIVRTLVDVDLREVSITAFPAYPDTKVKVRSIGDDYEEYHRMNSGEAERSVNMQKIQLMKNRLTILEKEC